MMGSVLLADLGQKYFGSNKSKRLYSLGNNSRMRILPQKCGHLHSAPSGQLTMQSFKHGPHVGLGLGIVIVAVFVGFG